MIQLVYSEGLPTPWSTSFAYCKLRLAYSFTGRTPQFEWPDIGNWVRRSYKVPLWRHSCLGSATPWPPNYLKFFSPDASDLKMTKSNFSMGIKPQCSTVGSLYHQHACTCCNLRSLVPKLPGILGKKTYDLWPSVKMSVRGVWVIRPPPAPVTDDDQRKGKVLFSR